MAVSSIKLRLRDLVALRVAMLQLEVYQQHFQTPGRRGAVIMNERAETGHPEISSSSKQPRGLGKCKQSVVGQKKINATRTRSSTDPDDRHTHKKSKPNPRANSEPNSKLQTTKQRIAGAARSMAVRERDCGRIRPARATTSTVATRSSATFLTARGSCSQSGIRRPRNLASCHTCWWAAARIVHDTFC